MENGSLWLNFTIKSAPGIFPCCALQGFIRRIVRPWHNLKADKLSKNGVSSESYSIHSTHNRTAKLLKNLKQMDSEGCLRSWLV